jgi:hypothetical protein
LKRKISWEKQVDPSLRLPVQPRNHGVALGEGVTWVAGQKGGLRHTAQTHQAEL